MVGQPCPAAEGGRGECGRTRRRSVRGPAGQRRTRAMNKLITMEYSVQVLEPNNINRIIWRINSDWIHDTSRLLLLSTGRQSDKQYIFTWHANVTSRSQPLQDVRRRSTQLVYQTFFLMSVALSSAQGETPSDDVGRILSTLEQNVDAPSIPEAGQITRLVFQDIECWYQQRSHSGTSPSKIVDCPVSWFKAALYSARTAYSV